MAGRREEDEEERGEAEMVLVGEVATTTSFTELPTGTRPGGANHLISLVVLIVMMRIVEVVIIFVKFIRPCFLDPLPLSTNRNCFLTSCS